MKFAGLFIRGLALFLDLIVFCVFFFPVTYIVKGTWLMTSEDHLWIIFDPLCAVFLVTMFLYYVLLEWLTGATAGKFILGIRVVNETGGKISFRQSIIRNAGRFIDGLPFLNLAGIISIATSPEKQRIGDKLAKTICKKIYKNFN
jgi:uncharacterized RDD family membrane protein YckC